MTVVLKYPGAKNRIADKLLSYMPEHKVYLESYAGSLAFLLQKPRSYIETVNDIDGRITNFFTVLRDRPFDLISSLSLTPYSRLEYEYAYQSHDNDDPVEMARILPYSAGWDLAAAVFIRMVSAAGSRKHHRTLQKPGKNFHRSWYPLQTGSWAFRSSAFLQ